MSISPRERASFSGQRWRDVSEAALIRGCIEQREKAWEELARRYGPVIRAAAARTLARSELPNLHQNTADVVQEVFLSLLRDNCARLRRLRNPEVLRSWLAMVAASRAIDWLRRHRDAPPNTPSEAREEPVSYDPSPCEVLIEEEERQTLRRAITDLDETERLVLFLFYRDGLKYREIAQITGLPINTVASHLHRARRKLRRLLAPAKAGHDPPQSQHRTAKDTRNG